MNYFKLFYSNYKNYNYWIFVDNKNDSINQIFDKIVIDDYFYNKKIKEDISNSLILTNIISMN